MTEEEVLGVLIYANELDGRHAPNEAKVYAWHEVFVEHAPGMPADFAREHVKKHYSRHEEMLTPSAVIRAWKDHLRFKNEARLALDHANAEAHCGKTGCMCTHANDCYKGWLDSKHPSAVVPCPICRPSLSEVLAVAAPLGMRNEHDNALIRNRDKSHA